MRFVPELLKLAKFNYKIDLITIDKNRFDKISKAFFNKKIMIVGDVMVDEYLFGNVDRLSPEAPVPVIEIKEEKLKFGGAANVAANVKGLGCIPLLVGGVGNDTVSEVFINMLTAEGMNNEGIIRFSERPTTVKTRIIGRSQHVARVDRESCAPLNHEETKQVIDRIRQYITEVDAIILEDYNKGFLNERVIKESVTLASTHKKIITVDPKFTNFMHYKHVNVFKPNIKETEKALAVVIDNEEDLISAGKRLLNQLQADNVLITRGAAGMTLFESKGSISHVPTKAWHVADVSGAGDTVIATLTAALTGDSSIGEAATLANYAAGIVCREIGVVPIAIEAMIEEYFGEHHKNK